MRNVFVARALCLALGLLATVASGEERGPVLLPPVVVPAPEEEEEAAPRPEAPSRKDPSGSTTVVEAAPRRGEVKDAAELAATAPGVLVRDSGGLGQAKDISIRGASTTGVLVLLDGLPLHGAGGLADLSLVPMAMVERVEVLRGGAGARYGSGGLGGVVNVVTPSPEGGARGGVQLTAGSFGTVLGNAAAAGPLGGGQGLLLLHGGLTRGDFTFSLDDRPELPGNPLVMLARENNDSAWGGALLKYHRALGGGWRASALGELSALSRGLAGTARNPTADARQQARRGSASVTLGRSSPEAGWELSARGFLRWDEGRFSGGYFGEGQEQALASAGVALDAGMLLGEHALSAGVELGGDGARDSSGANPAWLKVGFLAMDEVPLFSGLLVLAPSVRVDRIGPFTTFSPKLGVTAFLPADLELRANAGQAHRAPSFQELYLIQANMLPNDQLRPERALYADLSATWRGSPGWLTLGGFYSLYEDLISYEYYPPFLSRPFNFAAAAVWGLESELEVRPHPLVSGAASYTLMFSQNLRDDYRYYLRELPYRPRHRLQARLVVGPPRVRARLELAAQSRQFFNRTGELWLPARALLNAGLTVEVLSAPQVTASLELKNALDVHVEDVDGYPLPGRAAYVTFAFALDPAGKGSSQTRRGDHHAAVNSGE